MGIPYTEAIDILQEHANQRQKDFSRNGETIPPAKAVGRICRVTCYSPVSTPAFDTSAMDGFAVASMHTVDASPANPITFCVEDVIAAGDGPLNMNCSLSDTHPSCVQIMTGARFPRPRAGREFDACIKVEETSFVEGPDPRYRYIQITKPAQIHQNRRFAGTDFRRGDLIISSGTLIQPHHVMALAAFGIATVAVYRKLRVGIISTGSELISPDTSRDSNQSQIYDSNGPYIESLLTRLGAEVTNLGIFKDDTNDMKRFEDILLGKIGVGRFDILITTGAVSVGMFDFVKPLLEDIKAKICFHKVAIRPGHPVLLATLPNQTRQERRGRETEINGTVTPPVDTVSVEQTTMDQELVFFGLPGNPLAAAVCLRFLVIPYLQSLYSTIVLNDRLPATLTIPENTPLDSFMSKAPGSTFSKPAHLQVFWHGRRVSQTGEVSISVDQGSNKIRPLNSANCWVGVPAGQNEVAVGDMVDTFDMYPQLGT